MRRIFTSTIFVAVMLTASHNSFSQSFTQLTNLQCNAVSFSTSEDFQSATGTQGFFGPTWVLETSGSAKFLAAANGGSTTTSTTYSLTTPTYNTSTGNINIKFDVTGSAGLSTFTMYAQTTGSNNIPITGSISSPNGNICLSITGLPFGPNTNFRFVLQFTTNAGANGSGTLRFDNWFITPVTAAASVLPVKFQSLDARTVNSSVSLKWVVATEENLSGYNVERSIDGRNFSNVGFVKATDESTYSFVDTKPSSINYYRIKSVDINGKYGYSSIALVKAGKSMIVIKAFPTPFIKNISIQHPTAATGSTITISSADGRVIKSVIPAIGMQQTDVDLSTAKAGMYLVRYSNANGETETLKILKQQ